MTADEQVVDANDLRQCSFASVPCSSALAGTSGAMGEFKAIQVSLPLRRRATTIGTQISVEAARRLAFLSTEKSSDS
jgi:hypothetical protein